MGNEDVFGDGLEMHALEVEIEVSESCRHLALRQNDDYRNVDGALNVKIDRLRHHIRHVNLLGHACEFALYRGNCELDFLDKLLEVFGRFQVAGTGESFELLNDGQSRLCDRLLPLRVEERLLLGASRVTGDLAQDDGRNLQ